MRVYRVKTMEQNVRKKIESNTRNEIEQIASKQKEIARNQTTFNTHFKAYLENLPIP